MLHDGAFLLQLKRYSALLRCFPLYIRLTSRPHVFSKLQNIPQTNSLRSHMKLRFAIRSVAFLCAAFTPCFAHHTAVIVNRDNGVENVTSAHLTKIVRGEIKQWPDGKGIVLVLNRDSAGARAALEHLTRMSDGEWSSFLQAHKESIHFVDSDSEVLKEVQSEAGAVGLVEVHSIDNSVNVIHVDGKLPMEIGYLPH